MKKYIMLMVSAVVFAFASCTDSEEIEIKYEVEFNISANEVLKPFIKKESKDFDLKEEESLRLTMFLYRNDGSIVKKYEQTVKSYNDVCKIHEILTPGEYSTVCISSVISKEKLFSGDTNEYWSYSGEESKVGLTLKINPINAGTASATLGISENNFTIKDNETKKIDVQLTPATGMGIVTYKNCINSYIRNYYDPTYYKYYNTNFQFLYTAYNSMNYNGGNNWEYSNTLEKDRLYLYTFSVPVETFVDFLIKQGHSLKDLQNYSLYGYIVLLPGEFSLWCNYDKITSEGYRYDYGFGDSNGKDPKLKVEVGKSYDIVIDCDNLEMSTKELSATDRTKSVNGKSTDIKINLKNLQVANK